jgi:hypothetical protein
MDKPERNIDPKLDYLGKDELDHADKIRDGHLDIKRHTHVHEV